MRFLDFTQYITNLLCLSRQDLVDENLILRKKIEKMEAQINNKQLVINILIVFIFLILLLIFGYCFIF